MGRFIFLFPAFLSSCQTFPQASEYTRKTVISDIRGNVLRQNQERLILTKNSFEILYYNANGEIKDRWLTRYDSDVITNYDGGILHSISKRDRASGCESTKRFSNGLVSDFVSCGGREKYATHTGKDGTSQKECKHQGNLYTCVTTQLGKPPVTESEITDGNAVIFANDLFAYNGEQTYYKEVTKILPDGRQIELYEMDLPIGSPIPAAADNRWQLHRTERKASLISGLNLYSYVKIIDIDEDVIETQTIGPN